MGMGRRWVAGVLGVFLAVGGAWAATGQEPPATPFVRIETGEHTANINRFALNGDGTLLATASEDKTARLWSLPEGRLLRTMRVPIGEGSEGALYALALAQDGRTLFVAGDTGTSWDGSFSLYLFDAEKGRMKSRLSNLPARVLHFALSPDGERIAAVFGSTMGLKVWSSKTGKLLFEDGAYQATSNWVTFDAKGRLLTTSYDGQLRLYDTDHKKLVTLVAPGGKKPHAAAFNPDGTLLAVGYADQTRVDVLKGENLAPLYAPEVGGLKNTPLHAVAWLDQGKKLAAAGSTHSTADGVSPSLVRIWEERGKGRATDTRVSEFETVNQIQEIPGQGLGFVTAEPSWGILRTDGSKHPFHAARIPDFRSVVKNGFALSNDGRVVDFALQDGGKTLLRFDMEQLTLGEKPTGDGRTQPAKTTVANLTSRPDGTLQFKNKPLSLENYEQAASVAARPAPQGGFLLGTNFYLRLFDDQGKETRHVALPEYGYGLAVSGDGRRVVAALGDGTLRWYSLEAGHELEELTNLFVESGGKRWLAWSREGFFAHSEAGGKDLAGFHLNKGAKGTPEWVAFQQLYQLYYHPHLLQKKLTGGEEKAIQEQVAKIGDVATLLKQRATPGVEWLEYCLPAPQGGPVCQPITASLATRGFARTTQANAKPAIFSAELPADATTLKLRYRLLEREGGKGENYLFQNDRVTDPRKTTRGFARVEAPANKPGDGGEIVEQEVTLDKGNNRLYVRAFEKSNNTYGESGVIEFTLAAREVATRGGAESKPRLHVLTVGIDKYQIPSKNLNFARKDAEDFAKTVHNHFAKNHYGEVKGYSLYDSDATRANIVKRFDTVAQELKSEQDAVLIYMAAHGVTWDNGKGNTWYYLVTHDVKDGDDIPKNGFSQKDLTDNIGKLKRAENIFVFLDTCHSGAFDISDKALKEAGVGMDRMAESMGNLFFLAAASPTQEALDSFTTSNQQPAQNGLFAFVVLDGLKGKGKAHFNEETDGHNLGLFVKKYLKDLAKTRNHLQTAQFRTKNNDSEENPFFLTRPGP